MIKDYNPNEFKIKKENSFITWGYSLGVRIGYIALGFVLCALFVLLKLRGYI